MPRCTLELHDLERYVIVASAEDLRLTDRQFMDHLEEIEKKRQVEENDLEEEEDEDDIEKEDDGTDEILETCK